MVAGNARPASEMNRCVAGRGLSLQSSHISRKIREVDDFLARNPDAVGRLRETHPEVCFWALNDGQPLQHNKKKRSGRDERLALLSRLLPYVDALVAALRSEYRASQVGADDVLDAAAAALTGLLGVGGLLTLPEEPEPDTRGLPMEITYWPAG